MPNYDLRKRPYVLTAERALGHALPLGAIVHHVDENRANGRNDNLCVLQSQTEHMQLHRRLKILKAGGDPWTQQVCCTCRAVKDLDKFSPSKRARGSECRGCVARRVTPERLTPEQFSASQRERAIAGWKKRSAGVSNSYV